MTHRTGYENSRVQMVAPISTILLCRRNLSFLASVWADGSNGRAKTGSADLAPRM